jgi:hypothetical protein
MSRRVRKPFFSSLLRRIFALQNIPPIDSFPFLLAAVTALATAYKGKCPSTRTKTLAWRFILTTVDTTVTAAEQREI